MLYPACQNQARAGGGQNVDHPAPGCGPNHGPAWPSGPGHVNGPAWALGVSVDLLPSAGGGGWSESCPSPGRPQAGLRHSPCLLPGRSCSCPASIASPPSWAAAPAEPQSRPRYLCPAAPSPNWFQRPCPWWAGAVPAGPRRGGLTHPHLCAQACCRPQGAAP